MKRKIGLALAVILVGVFVVVYAQAKGEKVEPTSTPVSSSVAASSAPVATEEPAAGTEPTAGDGVEDEPVNQETEEQTPTNEGANYESDAEFDQKFSVEAEKAMQGYMDRGHTREEAEAWWQDRVEAGQQAATEEQRRLAESSAAAQERIEQEFAESAKATNDYYLERYGITKDQAMGMSPDELIELFNQKHGG